MMLRATFASLLTILLGALPCAAQSPGSGDPEPLPRVDPARELRGRALVEALRGGGFVLFVRHADQGEMPQSPDCAVPQLTAGGLAQARRIGEVLREASVPIGAVRSSPLCRARQTADGIAAGETVIAPGLAPSTVPAVVAERKRLLAEPAPARTNAILVSHVQGGDREDAIFIGKAGIVVYRPDGRGGTEPVARVPLEAWDALLREAPARQAGQAAAAR
ncbi:MAG: histidine phosphatase family protein [Betaproteobacteria bacterium]|nr:histidine phosphatase family protein [Betaproteobacteria bacterium]